MYEYEVADEARAGVPARKSGQRLTFLFSINLDLSLWLSVDARDFAFLTTADQAAVCAPLPA
jgi:hypothetical protein